VHTFDEAGLLDGFFKFLQELCILEYWQTFTIAIKIVQIQEQEAPHLLGLLDQAQQNLGPHNRIATLVVDRAYVDGPTLYKLEQQGIIWYLMGKTTMKARRMALALSDEGQSQERIEQARHGHGRETVVEELRTVIIPVSGIRTWTAYRPAYEEVGRLALQSAQRSTPSC